MSKQGDLKVWWMPQVGSGCREFQVPVPSAEIGALVLNALAEYDAFQLLNGIKPDYSNSGGLAEFDGEDWCDWEGSDAYDWADDPQTAFPQPDLGWCRLLPTA